MDKMLFEALLLIVKYCASCDDCNQCVMRDYCGKIPFEW